jgi:hypothetical protein
MTEDDFLSEAETPFEQSGIDMAELIAGGWLDCVTEVHREKARKYWAKQDAARAARDLFA